MQPVASQVGQDLKARLDARFRGPLMSFFLRRVRDRSEAEDLTQDVFARLLSAVERGEIDNSEAFVFRVAANLLNDRARRHARRGQSLSLDLDDQREQGVGPGRQFVEERDPERVLMGNDNLRRVLAALDELGQRTRDIYILFRLEQIKQREIAILYGISISTVEKEIMRATLHLAMRNTP